MRLMLTVFAGGDYDGRTCKARDSEGERRSAIASFSCRHIRLHLAIYRG